MPKIFKPDCAKSASDNCTQKSSLPVPQLRALRALAAGGLTTLAALGESGDTLAALERAGFAVRDELDVDGVVERVWQATDVGRAALAGDAMAGAAVTRKEPAHGLRARALVPVFGSNRGLAAEVGKLLMGCKWVGVPFMGGLCEVPHMGGARTLVLNDMHGAIVNLARCAACPKLGPALWRRLRRHVFSEGVLRAMQEVCLEREGSAPPDQPDLDWAEAYHAVAWMSRNGTAGTKGELRSGLSIRWHADGGDSALRFGNAADGVLVWHRLLVGRATILCRDAFDFLADCLDRKGNGIYVDAPWPDDGNCYKYKFDEYQQRELAKALRRFSKTIVVIRFGDHPLVRELYPEEEWVWHRLVGKTNSNKNKMEVLITNGKGNL